MFIAKRKCFTWGAKVFKGGRTLAQVQRIPSCLLALYSIEGKLKRGRLEKMAGYSINTFNRPIYLTKSFDCDMVYSVVKRFLRTIYRVKTFCNKNIYVRKEDLLMIITATEMKSNFGKYLDLVEREDITLTRNGKIVAVIMKPKKNSAYGTLSKYASEDLRKTEKNVMEREIVKKYENSGY